MLLKIDSEIQVIYPGKRIPAGIKPLVGSVAGYFFTHILANFRIVTAVFRKCGKVLNPQSYYCTFN